MNYVFDDNKNKHEGLSKEEIYAVLAQAIEDGDLEHIDTSSAFVSKLKSVLTGETHSIEFVTEAQYNAMEQAGTLVAGTYYYITDDSTLEDIEAALEDLQEALENKANKSDFSQNQATQFGDYVVSKKRQIESLVTSLDINTSTYLIDFGELVPISTIMNRKFVFTFLITYTSGTSVLIKSSEISFHDYLTTTVGNTESYVTATFVDLKHIRPNTTPEELYLLFSISQTSVLGLLLNNAKLSATLKYDGSNTFSAEVVDIYEIIE